VLFTVVRERGGGSGEGGGLEAGAGWVPKVTKWGFHLGVIRAVKRCRGPEESVPIPAIESVTVADSPRLSAGRVGREMQCAVTGS